MHSLEDVLDGIGDAADGGAHDDGTLARVHPGLGLCRDRGQRSLEATDVLPNFITTQAA